MQADTVLFLDETGDHSLGTVDPSFPIFLLCGCLFTRDAYENFCTASSVVKMNFWNTKDVIFHSRCIRRYNEPFHILFDKELKERFLNDLNKLVEDASFTVFAAAIDKEAHLRKYGKVAIDPYDMSLSFIMERVIFYLSDLSKRERKTITCKLVFEKRGKKEDIHMTSQFNKIRDAGTGYVDASRMKLHIIGCDFKAKTENHNGLQCADLCAYPLARSLVLKGSPSKAADIVRPKIYANNGRQYGLKIFPHK